MRAARFHPGEGLRIEEVPRPEAGAGEVVVEVGGCGVCHSDLHVMDGNPPLVEPRVLGHEVAGTVAETGAGVDLDPGTDVAVFGGWGCRDCATCARGNDQLCNLSNWLGWAVGVADRQKRGGGAATQATTGATPSTSACRPPTTASRWTVSIPSRPRR